jgi:hypothetical protein
MTFALHFIHIICSEVEKNIILVIYSLSKSKIKTLLNRQQLQKLLLEAALQDIMR